MVLIKNLLLTRIYTTRKTMSRGKERGRIATAYSFPRKIFKMNASLFQEKTSE